MKKIIAMSLTLMSAFAFAGGTTPLAEQQQQQSSTSQSDASNAGNNQIVTGPTIVIGNGDNSDPQTINQNVTQSGDTTSRVVYSGTQTVKNVPSVGGPPLVSSNDTCMGSASAAINAPGLGLAIGKTYTDTNCVMLKNSRELWNMGMKAAAMARMCMDGENMEALELTGFVCPQTERNRAQKQVTMKESDAAKTSSVYTGNDPFVKARLGLK